MNEAEIRLDFARRARIRFDEAILCARKSGAQPATIMNLLLTREVSSLMTRMEPAVFDALPVEHKEKLDYDPLSKPGFFNWRPPKEERQLPVAGVAAGSSDMPQAVEVIRTLTYFGLPTERFIDVGVAGLWRLLDQVEHLLGFPVVVAVAGIDGALPSVLGGLEPSSIICVPMSTRYGASRGGETLSAASPGRSCLRIL